MAENENNESWLNNALSTVQTIVAPYYEYRAEKEKAKLQTAIETNTVATTQQTQAQATLSNNTAKNVILVVGATLGMILAFGLLKKALK